MMEGTKETKHMTSLIDTDGDDWLRLLFAFIGYFMEEKTTEEDDDIEITKKTVTETITEEMKLLSDTCEEDCHYIFYGLRQSLRYLIYDNNTLRAKRKLEHIANTVSQWEWLNISLTQYDCHRDNRSNDESKIDFSMIHKQINEEKKKKECIMKDITDVYPNFIKFSHIILPCALLNIVYILVCSQCVKETLHTDVAFSRLNSLLFNQPLCTNSPRTTKITHNVLQVDELKTSEQFTPLKDTHRQLMRYFSNYWTNEELSRVLLFIDAYQAWLKRDFHSVLEYTERFFSTSQLREEYSPLMWLLYETLLCIYAFAIVTVTSMAHSSTRSKIKESLQRIEERYNNKYFVGDVRETCRSETQPTRSFVVSVLYNIIHCEILHCDSINNEDDFSRFCERCVSSLNLSELWQDSFFCGLRIWLRAKRLTDGGKMTESRDLILWALQGLYTDVYNNSVTKDLSSTFMKDNSSDFNGHDDDNDVFVSLHGVKKCVVMSLLPSLWLRQLFLVNCAALADTHNLFCFLQRLKEPLTIAEVMYIAASPTLAAGGVHSSIFTSFFIMNNMETINTAQDVKEQFGWLSLPVRILLFSHRLWQLRQRLLYELPRRPDANINYESQRLSLQREMVRLCEVLLTDVRGLIGSLELSFTDCAPHRVMFNAITVTCDIQEDILRDAASNVAGAFSASPSVLSQCDSNGNNGHVDNDNGTIAPHNTLLTSGANTHVLLNLPSIRTSLVDPLLDCVSEVNDIDHYHHNNIDENNIDNSDSWLKVNTESKLRTSMEPYGAFSSSSSSSFIILTAERVQDLYWIAHSRAEQWMNILENNFSHLPLIVEVCRLRISAASFEKETAQMAHQLITTFHDNALACAHGAIALFASLHVVSAERCIREALEENPHSAELRRLYNMICEHENFSEEEMQINIGEKKAVEVKTKHVPKPEYAYRYRGLLPVRYVASSQGLKALCLPIIISLLCVFLLGASFILDVNNVGSFNILYNVSELSLNYELNNTSTPDKIFFQWSFVLLSDLPVYWGFGIIIYAIIAAIIVPFIATYGTDMNSRSHIMTRFLRALMEEDCLVDDVFNRIIFCLRGLPLVNLITSIQLVVANALWLDASVKEECVLNSGAKDRDMCGRVFTTWGTVSLLILIFLIAIATVFHGRAWRVLRCSDVIVGSLPTFITIFFIDVVFFIILFPILFMCCVILEPILFLTNVFFTAILSLPLLVEHIPTILSDKLLAPLSIPTPCFVWQCGEANELFCVQATSWLRERLCASMPPLHWSPSRRHDRLILCAHEVMQPVLGDKKRITYAYAFFRTLVSFLRGLGLRGISICIAMHNIIDWRSYHSPWESEGAIQLALLRENCTAVIISTPPDVGFDLTNGRNMLTATNGIESTACVVPPSRGKVTSKISYG